MSATTISNLFNTNELAILHGVQEKLRDAYRLFNSLNQEAKNELLFNQPKNHSTGHIINAGIESISNLTKKEVN